MDNVAQCMPLFINRQNFASTFAVSGCYALACRKEAGPRGSWTEEQEREGDRERSDYTEPTIAQGHGPTNRDHK